MPTVEALRYYLGQDLADLTPRTARADVGRTSRPASSHSRLRNDSSVGASMAFFRTMKRSRPVLLIAERELTDVRCERFGRAGVRPFGAKPRPQDQPNGGGTMAGTHESPGHRCTSSRT